MVNAFTHPFFCTSRTYSCSKVFDNLTTIIENPSLHLEEKWLWIWLATKSARKSFKACAYSYEDISLAMNLSCKQVHRALFRLLTMGFLNADLPLWYGELPHKMCIEMHLLVPTIPSKAFLDNLAELRKRNISYTNTPANVSKMPACMNFLKEEKEND